MGKTWFSESQTRKILHAALEGGITHFDTAGFYGEAERRLGRALTNTHDDVFISTKTGTSFGANGRARKDFSKAAITADVDTSLQRLGRERLDLLYLHGPNKKEMAACEPVLVDLKAQGKIRYAGICGEGKQLEQAASLAFIDVLMGRYNIIHQEHAPIFAKAKENDKAVIAIAPLMQGLYQKKFFLPNSRAKIWYIARALVKNRAQIKHVRSISEHLSEPGWDKSSLALAFVLANSDIDLAVTTTTKLDHLHASLNAAGRPLPDQVLKRLSALSEYCEDIE
ncbi:MAG: aldo/keto reductase [Robiginitomaculum sp.]|nr:aldo/keto reductase [Robiginitomaculum sp.]